MRGKSSQSCDNGRTAPQNARGKNLLELSRTKELRKHIIETEEPRNACNRNASTYGKIFTVFTTTEEPRNACNRNASIRGKIFIVFTTTEESQTAYEGTQIVIEAISRITADVFGRASLHKHEEIPFLKL